MRSFFRFAALAIAIFFVTFTGGGCGGSDNDRTSDGPVSQIDAASIYRAVQDDLISAELIEDASRGRVVAAYRVDLSEVSILDGASFAAGDLTLSFRTRSGSAGAFVDVDCFSDGLRDGGYYAFLFRESSTTPWNESLSDQVLTFDGNYSFGALMSAGTNSFEFALVEVDPGAFTPRDGYKIGIRVDDGTADEVVHRKISVPASGGLRPLYVYTAYAPATEAQLENVGLQYGAVLTALADARPEWTEYAAAVRLQDLIGWNGSFFDELYAALTGSAAVAGKSHSKAENAAVATFLSEMPRWEQSGEGLGVPDLQSFLYGTGLKLTDVINTIEGGSWDGRAGSAGFFDACRARNATFGSLENLYLWWCVHQVPERNSEDVVAFGNFMAEYFTAPEASLRSAGINIDPAAALLGILNLAWDFVKSGKPVAEFSSLGTRVLLNSDMEPMNFPGAVRNQTGKFTYTVHDSIITSWELARLEVRGVLDYDATYKGSKVSEWQDRGTFIPNFYIKTEACSASFGMSLNARANCSYPVNRGPVDMSYAEPEVEGCIEIRDTAFGLFGNQKFIDFTIDGKKGITRFRFR